MEMDELNGRRRLSPTLKPQTSLLTDRLVGGGQAQTPTCERAREHPHKHTQTRTQIHTDTRKHTSTCTYPNTYILTHINTHTDSHFLSLTYTHTHIHSHTLIHAHIFFLTLPLSLSCDSMMDQCRAHLLFNRLCVINSFLSERLLRRKRIDIK